MLKADHPEQAYLIDAYYVRFGEMMPGPIAGSVDILGELHARGTPLYALTNFSAETYSLACRQFAFLGWFRGVLVSGEEKVIKPDPRIYELLIDRFGIDPHAAVFIDDVAANVEAALRFGIHGIHFRKPDALRAQLVELAARFGW